MKELMIASFIRGRLIKDVGFIDVRSELFA
jgi:hypothetical protein